MANDYDIVVIGGGPAGYAGAIRGAQLGKRVLCVERDKLGGICLNWGCIPTKALLSNAHLVEMVSKHGKRFGYSGQGEWDFGQIIGRSRNVAGQLNKGIEGLFRKYKVASKLGVAKVIAPNQVQIGEEKVSAGSIVIATGARPRPLPGVEFDGKTIITYKEAMSLAKSAEIDAHHRRQGRSGWNSATSITPSAPRSPWSRCSTACSPARTRRCRPPCARASPTKA